MGFADNNRNTQYHRPYPLNVIGADLVGLFCTKPPHLHIPRLTRSEAPCQLWPYVSASERLQLDRCQISVQQGGGNDACQSACGRDANCDCFSLLASTVTSIKTGGRQCLHIDLDHILESCVTTEGRNGQRESNRAARTHFQCVGVCVCVCDAETALQVREHAGVWHTWPTVFTEWADKRRKKRKMCAGWAAEGSWSCFSIPLSPFQPVSPYPHYLPRATPTDTLTHLPLQFLQSLPPAHTQDQSLSATSRRLRDQTIVSEGVNERCGSFTRSAGATCERAERVRLREREPRLEHSFLILCLITSPSSSFWQAGFSRTVTFWLSRRPHSERNRKLYWHHRHYVNKIKPTTSGLHTTTNPTTLHDDERPQEELCVITCEAEREKTAGLMVPASCLARAQTLQYKWAQWMQHRCRFCQIHLGK